MTDENRPQPTDDPIRDLLDPARRPARPSERIKRLLDGHDEKSPPDPSTASA